MHPRFLGHFSGTASPTLAVLAFAAAFGILLVRFLLYRHPTESGLLWALVAAFLSFQVGAVGPAATAYAATAGLILISSIIENSYLLAYHDELTTLPARRAFNDALFHLEEPYTVAVVDIDHFKKFNDTYGHETGDQVLRMVAGKLAGITGGGRAYRVGGEEFSILFPGKTAKDAMPHLELLRSVIEVSTFRVRAARSAAALRKGAGSYVREASPGSGQDFRGQDRRSSERRTQARRAAAPRRTTRPARPSDETPSAEISVTVSIGVAEPRARIRAVEDVIQAADQALYRAKQSGRNRVEFAAVARVAKIKRNIA